MARGGGAPLLHLLGLGELVWALLGLLLCPVCGCGWNLANCALLLWAVGSTALGWKGVISCSSGEERKARTRKLYLIKAVNVGVECQ